VLRFSFPSLEPNSYSVLSCIIIHVARNAEKRGVVLKSIILPNLNHSCICPVPDSVSGLRISAYPYASKDADSRKTLINAFHGQWTLRFTDSLVSGQLYLRALFSIPLCTCQSNSVFKHSRILSEKCRCLGEDQKKRRDKGVLLLPWRACFRSRYSFFLSLFLRYVLKLY